MIWLFYLLALVIGAYVGRAMAFTVKNLPKVLLNEDEQKEEPRDLIKHFFSSEICPDCGKKRSLWHSTPIIGYLISRGKCTECEDRRDKKEIFLEIGMALVFAATALIAPTCYAFLFVVTMVSLIICCFITDCEYGILPDQLTLSLMWVGLIASIPSLFINSQAAILGAVGGYGLLWFVNEIYRAWRKQDGMYPGDFKLNGALGACLGLPTLIPVLVIALAVVIVVSIAQLLYGKFENVAAFLKQEISYGCYVAVIALITIYIKLFGVSLY
jgi:leader peptidase (prepilin peptidase)/N-methyltransferase